MYYLTKVFEVPISHRLSKHLGRCFLFHGHNLKIEVTIKSNFLNQNDMVIDFSRLKELVNSIIQSWDHGMFINKNDFQMIEALSCDLHIFQNDPTSEVLCKYLFDELKKLFGMPDKNLDNIIIHSITIWETRDSKSTYKED